MKNGKHKNLTSKYAGLFKEQKKLIKSRLAKGVKFKRMTSREMNNKFYSPGHVITSDGQVWSLSEGDFLEQGICKTSGYLQVYKIGYPNRINRYVHILVAWYFCDRSLVYRLGYNKVVVHHRNLNKLDNRACNLCFRSAVYHRKLHSEINRQPHPIKDRQKYLWEICKGLCIVKAHEDKEKKGGVALE